MEKGNKIEKALAWARGFRLFARPTAADHQWGL